jgi:CRISPR-associated exonuclease Cas4
MVPLIPTILLALAAAAFALAAFLRRRAGTLPGQVVYSDTNRRAVTEPITSHRLRLTGKPDYVYSLVDQAFPSEVKRHRIGRNGPRDWDVIQLLTYCMLIEDVWGVTVTHGLLEYSDRRFTIPYGLEQRRQVLELADEIRVERWAGPSDRSHNEAGRCWNCWVRASCGQALN